MDDPTRTIAEQVLAMRANAAPNPGGDAYLSEQRALDELPLPAIPPLGSVFPDGDLLDVHGARTTLGYARNGTPAVVIFYRGAWCPFCNIALRTYQRQLVDPLADAGVALVAISPQTADGSMTMREKHELDFAVLSDPGNQIASRLGIMTEPSAEARAAQRSHGLDLAEHNADGTVALPMPTVALVDADGTLVWIDVHPDYATRTEPADILDAVDRLFVASKTN